MSKLLAKIAGTLAGIGLVAGGTIFVADALTAEPQRTPSSVVSIEPASEPETPATPIAEPTAQPAPEPVTEPTSPSDPPPASERMTIPPGGELLFQNGRYETSLCQSSTASFGADGKVYCD